MTRQTILTLIDQAEELEPRDREQKRLFRSFIEEHPNCFERSCLTGHLTGSAWVLDQERTHVILQHHRKLDIWVQLGGHADGDCDLIRVATKEALEESGLSSVALLSPEIFDLDAHHIPEFKGVPSHIHYDVRFIFEANRNEPLTLNEESKELAWASLDEVSRYTRQESVLRLVRKSTPFLVQAYDES